MRVLFFKSGEFRISLNSSKSSREECEKRRLTRTLNLLAASATEMVSPRSRSRSSTSCGVQTLKVGIVGKNEQTLTCERATKTTGKSGDSLRSKRFSHGFRSRTLPSVRLEALDQSLKKGDERKSTRSSKLERWQNSPSLPLRLSPGLQVPEAIPTSQHIQPPQIVPFVPSVLVAACLSRSSSVLWKEKGGRDGRSRFSL